MRFKIEAKEQRNIKSRAFVCLRLKEITEQMADVTEMTKGTFYEKIANDSIWTDEKDKFIDAYQELQKLNPNKEFIIELFIKEHNKLIDHKTYFQKHISEIEKEPTLPKVYTEEMSSTNQKTGKKHIFTREEYADIETSQKMIKLYDQQINFINDCINELTIQPTN